MHFLRMGWGAFYSLLLSLTFSGVCAVGPRLVFPELLSTNQPADITFSWEGGPVAELINNGGFEPGTGGGWLASGTQSGGTRLLNSIQSTNSAQGRYYGQFSGMADRLLREMFLYQSFTIPRGNDVTARLSWKDFTLASSLESPGIYRVRLVVSGSSRSPVTLYQSDVGRNDTEGFWKSHEMDMTQYLGQSVVLEFNMTNNAPSRMMLNLDDVRFDIHPKAPVYELYLGLSPLLDAGNLVSRSTNTSFAVTGLAPGKNYYWRVVQIGGGRQLASRDYVFRTGGTPVDPQPFVIATPTVSNGMLRLSFPTESGQSYRVRRMAATLEFVWSTVSGSIRGTGETAVVEIPLPTEETGYYRVYVE